MTPKVGPGILGRIRIMDEKSYTSIMKAKPLFFQRVPSTNSCKEACLSFSKHLQNKETRKRSRKTKDIESFDDAVGRIIGDLLYAYKSINTDWVYRSLYKDSFIGEPVGAVTFRAVIDVMIDEGFLVQHKGGNVSNPFAEASESSPKFSPGMASRFKAKPKLIRHLKKLGLNASEQEKHFKLEMPRRTIKLKVSSRRLGRNKIKGRLIRPKWDDVSYRLSQQVHEINEYLAKQSLDGGNFNGFQRTFNEADREDFNWNMGGRLYAVGDESYQLMKKPQRLKMRINNLRVAEIDINASYLSILASRLNYPLPNNEDLYSAVGLPREVVKAWITSTLGNDGFLSRWPAEANARLKEKGIDTSKGMTMKEVQRRVCEVFPFIEAWDSCGIRWSNLMFQESEQIITAMEILRDDYDIPSYPVHDSLIVPSKHIKVAEEALKTSFEMHSNFNCRLTVSKA